MNHETLPVLASCDSAERRAAAARVMDLLKPVFPKDVERLIEIDDDSDRSSDVPDPFSDDEIDQSRKTDNRKRLSKNETDQLVMSNFTEEHKRVERLVREQTGILESDDPCAEDLHTEVRLPMKDVRGLSPEFMSELKALNAQSGLDVYLKKKEQEEQERLAKNKSKKKPPRPQPSTRKTPTVPEVMDTNSMSGVWRMLDASSPDGGFAITQPDYNVLEDDRLDWLRREDMSWQQRDDVKHKCEKWMKKCNI